MPEALLEERRGAATAAKRWKADLALVVVAFIWGSTFVIVKKALADTSTILFLALRFALAGAVLAYGARQVRVDRRLARASLVVGLAMFAGYLLQTWGLRLTTPSKSAFITGFSIVLVPIFVGLAFRRFAGWAPLAGVASALTGLYLLTTPSGGGPVNRGDLLTLGCAAAFALHIIFLGHYSRQLPPVGLAAGQVVVAGALAFAAVPWAERVFLRLTPGLLLAIVVTGLLATALAFFVQTWAQQFTSPAHTALIFALEPVFAWLTSWVVLGERLGGRAALGALLILAGIILAELASRK